jgi:hypothetical protein
MRSCLLALLLTACGPADGDLSAYAETLGIDGYLGATPAASTEEVGDALVSTFATEDGPRCMRGAPFRASTREGASNDLLVFLQGGGACFSEFCLAVTAAPPGVPPIAAFDRDEEANPFRDFDVAYAPYCDGSLFVGDADVDDDGDGTPDRFHRGLANLSATLNVAQEQFPAPDRVVLAGSSAGAYGTLLGVALVRAVYPDVELVVMHDSGLGVAKGQEDPAFLERMLVEFGALDFLPDDCEGCLESGHVTGLIDWWFQRDDAVRIGAFSTWYDLVIGEIFLQLPATTFRDIVDVETRALQQAYPGRYRRFLLDGRAHTSLLGNASGILGDDLGAVEVPPGALLQLTSFTFENMYEARIGDLLLADWIGGLVDGDRDMWVDVSEPAGPPPEAE